MIKAEFLFFSFARLFDEIREYYEHNDEFHDFIRRLIDKNFDKNYKFFQNSTNELHNFPLPQTDKISEISVWSTKLAVIFCDRWIKFAFFFPTSDRQNSRLFQKSDWRILKLLKCWQDYLRGPTVEIPYFFLRDKLTKCMIFPWQNCHFFPPWINDKVSASLSMSN